ncbi:hypothetical protein H2248_006976 [Termitomyces sp. 'cryptogamus']|nr:hypothetical protein H2248_006976 [Termitomyces sp. 'cryptogamus']
MTTNSVKRTLNQEELPGWRKSQMEMVEKYITQELYIEQIPPWLIDRNYPNTQFVPPIFYLGFEITLPDEDDITNILGSWDIINVHAGEKLVEICYG